MVRLAVTKNDQFFVHLSKHITRRDITKLKIYRATRGIFLCFYAFVEKAGLTRLVYKNLNQITQRRLSYFGWKQRPASICRPEEKIQNGSPFVRARN